MSSPSMPDVFERLRQQVPGLDPKALTGPQGLADAGVWEPLAAALEEYHHTVQGLEQDLESMSISSLALMEESTMMNDVLAKASNCRSDNELALLGLSSLLVATSVERAVFVRFVQPRGCCETVAEVVPDGDGHEAIEDEGFAGQVYHAGDSVLSRILDGAESVLVDAASLREDSGPEVPGSDAQNEVLAVPVHFGEGDQRQLIGAIVLTDPRDNVYASARRFGTQEIKLAQSVATTLGAAVGQRRVAAVDRELKLAHEIQQQILPQVPALIPGFDLAGRCETPGAIGGDYFDFLPMPDERHLVVVADVSGHNLASGMVMVSARSALRVLASQHSDPSIVFTALHDSIFGDLMRTERFITAAGVAVRPGGEAFEFVNAGHNPPLLYRAATGRVELMKGNDPILGLVAGVQFGMREVDVAPGDVLLLYTDGVTEATSEDGEMFEEERLAAVLRESASGSAAEILDSVFSAVREFADREAEGDDVTAVVLKRIAAGDIE